MYGWSISEVRWRYIEALKRRDTAYFKYIHSDASEFGYQDNKWDLDKANGEVSELRRMIQREDK